jgi:hypothetical protein
MLKRSKRFNGGYHFWRKSRIYLFLRFQLVGGAHTILISGSLRFKIGMVSPDFQIYKTGAFFACRRPLLALKGAELYN